MESYQTCPDCGQTGFLEGGLKTHRGSKSCQRRASTATVSVLPQMAEVEIVPTSATVAEVPASKGLMPEFDAARAHVESIREHGRRAAHESILLGHELNRLKKELGVSRGGDRKSKPQSAVLIPWQDLVEQQTGLSIDTCDRCMTLAAAAKKHIPILTAGDVLETPFAALPEKRKAEVVKALEKAADGQSMTQMMFAFGAWKDKKPNTPPKPTKASAAKRLENQGNEALQLETLAKHAEENVIAVEHMTMGEAWKALDRERLLNFVTKTMMLPIAALPELASRAGALPALVEIENQLSGLVDTVSSLIKEARRAGR